MAAVSLSKRSIRIIQSNYNNPANPGSMTTFQDVINTMQGLGATRLAIYQAQDFTSPGVTGEVFTIVGMLTAANDATLVTHFAAWQTSLGTTLDTDVVTVLSGF